MQRRSLKDRVLDHAELRLLEQGYRGMRVDELARDVGISKRTLYELFRTKEDMASEALTRMLADLLVKLDRAIIDHPDHGDQLRQIIALLGESFVNARQPFYRDLESTPALIELVDNTRVQIVERIDRVLLAGVAEGRFRSDIDPDGVRLVLTATLDFLQRQGQARSVVARNCAALYDLVSRGLLAG